MPLRTSVNNNNSNNKKTREQTNKKILQFFPVILEIDAFLGLVAQTNASDKTRREAKTKQNKIKLN